jgi:beta-galactosidase
LDAGNTEVIAKYHNDEPAIVRNERFIYLGTLTNRDFLLDFLQQQCHHNNINTYRFDEDIRVSQRGKLIFAFNYSDQQHLLPLDSDTTLLLGNRIIQPHGITVWQASDKAPLLKK